MCSLCAFVHVKCAKRNDLSHSMLFILFTLLRPSSCNGCHRFSRYAFILLWVQNTPRIPIESILVKNIKDITNCSLFADVAFNTLLVCEFVDSLFSVWRCLHDLISNALAADMMSAANESLWLPWYWTFYSTLYNYARKISCRSLSGATHLTASIHWLIICELNGFVLRKISTVFVRCEQIGQTAKNR